MSPRGRFFPVSGHPRRRGLAFLTGLLVTPLLFPPLPAVGQEEGWNSPRARELVADARRLRHSTQTDPDFQSYSAQARGYVYFFLDRKDTGERILVKTDQIALEVFWRAPDQGRQRIVGLRDRKSLPTNIRYHLDHLLVVQDNFGDRIRIGDGDEVSSVIHPMAPGSEEFYDFLLADSLTLFLPASGDTIRVYELKVRPKDFSVPAFLGSVFLDRDTRGIVRLAFTFTPASYVDPYLDHIRISLENGLWMGKHWLPYRQELEIRREVPYLDIPAGSVIRGWFEIRDYEINPTLPPYILYGPPVTAVPEEQRRSFPFEEGLHAHLEREGLPGLRTPPSMEEIRALARQVAGERYLSGLRRFRLFLPAPAVSSALRLNRAEGLFVGGGLSYQWPPDWKVGLHGGLSSGRERPGVRVSVETRGGSTRGGAEFFWNHPRDVGPLPGTDGVLNTLSVLALRQDYQDLYFTTGTTAFLHGIRTPGGDLTLEGRWERHTPGRDVLSGEGKAGRYRPVLPLEAGEMVSLGAGIRRAMPFPLAQGELRMTGGRFRERPFAALQGILSLHRPAPAEGLDLWAELRGGAVLGEAPFQAFAFLGGRGTLPGYPFRAQAGKHHWLLRTEVSGPLASPWLRWRALAAAGHAWGGASPLVPRPTDPSPPLSGVLATAGAGVALGWDVLRFDLARGIGGGGKWEFFLSVNPRLWPWL